MCFVVISRSRMVVGCGEVVCCSKGKNDGFPLFLFSFVFFFRVTASFCGWGLFFFLFCLAALDVLGCQRPRDWKEMEEKWNVGIRMMGGLQRGGSKE